MSLIIDKDRAESRENKGPKEPKEPKKGRTEK